MVEAVSDMDEESRIARAGKVTPSDARGAMPYGE